MESNETSGADYRSWRWSQLIWLKLAEVNSTRVEENCNSTNMAQPSPEPAPRAWSSLQRRSSLPKLIAMQMDYRDSPCQMKLPWFQKTWLYSMWLKFMPFQSLSKLSRQPLAEIQSSAKSSHMFKMDGQPPCQSNSSPTKWGKMR